MPFILLPFRTLDQLAYCLLGSKLSLNRNRQRRVDKNQTISNSTPAYIYSKNINQQDILFATQSYHREKMRQPQVFEASNTQRASQAVPHAQLNSKPATPKGLPRRSPMLSPPLRISLTKKNYLNSKPATPKGFPRRSPMLS